jgi:hypothetical protein
MWHDQPSSFLFSSLQSDCNQSYEWMKAMFPKKGMRESSSANPDHS